MTSSSRLFVAATALSFLAVPLAGLADSKEALKNVYALYKKGAYAQALDALSAVKGDKATQAMTEYWAGLCQSRLQSFDEAVSRFDRALALGVKAEDIEYERGQALYASGKLKPSRDAFKKSVAARFKVGASLYYMGFISQSVEEYSAAFGYYGQIEKLTDDSDHVKQSALLQIAEIKLGQIDAGTDPKTKKEKLRSEAIPAFQKAYRFDEASATGKQAQAKIAMIESRLGGADAQKMRNGVPIAAQPSYIRLTEDVKYDTNVITQADQALTKVSNTASYLAKTDVFGKYEFIFDRFWVMSPEVGISHTVHSRRTVPTVFQNDSLSVTTSLKNRLEHTLFDSPAALNFDFEYNLLLRDYKQNHTYPYYSRYFNFTLGQRAKIFGQSNTSLNASVKLLANEDEGQNATDPGLTLSQGVRFTRLTNLTISLNGDYNRARTKTNDKINYRLTLALSSSDLVDGIDFTWSLDSTITDTREQKSTRGYEKTISPTITARKNFDKHLFVACNYSFTRNYSKDLENYAYSKHVMGMGLGYQF